MVAAEEDEVPVVEFGRSRQYIENFAAMRSSVYIITEEDERLTAVAN